MPGLGSWRGVGLRCRRVEWWGGGEGYLVCWLGWLSGWVLMCRVVLLMGYSPYGDYMVVHGEK